MATPSEALPFSLSFIVAGEQVRVDRFYQSEEDFYAHIEEPSVTLAEQVSMELLFASAHEEARLYMYGLETIPYDGVKTDEEGQPYLSPHPTPLPFFQPEYYPLIPGTYQIRVAIGERTWLAPLLILPKQLSFRQLELMREELEQVLRGLSLDIIGNRLSRGDHLGKALPPQLFRQFLTISSHFDRVMAAISDLYTRVNFRTRTDYQLVPADRAKVVDGITVRHQLKHPELKGYLMAPVKTVDYNLPENIWMKRMIQRLIAVLNQFVGSVEAHARHLEEEIQELSRFSFQESTRNLLAEKEKAYQELLRYIEMVQRMKVGFQMIVSAPWYEQVQAQRMTSIPNVLATDSRYRTIYLLYSELQQEEMEVALDPQFSMHWKRTDKLYEIWGFVQLLRFLTEWGLEPIGGWIFDAQFDRERMLVPTLPAGERIVLQKGELLLHYVYDGIIPLASKETSMYQHPLYMLQQHNRPDGRLDLYEKGIYKGTVMLDFKYRPIRNFWDSEQLTQPNRKREMDQLIAYSNARSNYLYGGHSSWTQRMRPVAEVWAFYPVREGRWEPTIANEDHDVRIIPFSPGGDNTHVLEEVDRVIRRILQDSQNFTG